MENGDATVPVLNPIRVRGYFVYQQVYSCNSKMYVPPVQCIVSFVWNLEHVAFISLRNIFWSVFITEKDIVCRRMKSEFLKNFEHRSLI